MTPVAAAVDETPPGKQWSISADLSPPRASHRRATPRDAARVTRVT
jgi:hypothetical protein